MESPTSLRFSEIYKNESLTGLTLGINSRTEIEQQYQYWTEFKNNEMPQERQKIWMDRCRTIPIHSSSPFCPFFIKEGKIKAKELGLTSLPASSGVTSRLTSAQALTAWKSQNWAALAGRTDSEVQPILNTIRSPQSALNTADRILKRSQCVSSSLLFGVGLKLESAFPNPAYRSKAEAIYQMALSCGNDQGAVAAGYRLGLFKIWQGRYDEAETILSKIPDLPHASDYRMRIGYWRYSCAAQNKDEVLKAQLRAWLTREYPLSFHSLLVHPSKLGSDLQWKQAQDPEVFFRPVSNPDLGASTAAIEYLLSRGDRRSARSLLFNYQEDALKEAPQFRLYWAILLKRAGVYSENFRFMASAFRESPGLISRPTLEILYPTQFFQYVPSVQPHLDRFFTLSIIRQESAFDPNAVSPARAMGLMQLQLPTARGYERRVSIQQLWEPETNIRIGSKYINRLIESERGSIELALAAYNAGPGRIRQWKARYPISNRLLFIDLLPARETREYVSSILRNYFWYLKLYSTDEPIRKIANDTKNSVSVDLFRGALEPYLHSITMTSDQ
jgi:soluble lytic murein transglycosylase